MTLFNQKLENGPRLGYFNIWIWINIWIHNQHTQAGISINSDLEIKLFIHRPSQLNLKALQGRAGNDITIWLISHLYFTWEKWVSNEFKGGTEWDRMLGGGGGGVGSCFSVRGSEVSRWHRYEMPDENQGKLKVLAYVLSSASSLSGEHGWDAALQTVVTSDEPFGHQVDSLDVFEVFCVIDVPCRSTILNNTANERLVDDGLNIGESICDSVI